MFKIFRKRKKDQVIIKHQSDQDFHNNLVLFRIVLVILTLGVFVIVFIQPLNKQPIQKNTETNLQEKKMTLKEVKDKIKKDYKSNLLQQQMERDQLLHNKDQYAPKAAINMEEAKEDYSLKEGVDLEQDKSFDHLLSTTQDTNDLLPEDVEDYISQYQLKVQKNKKPIQEENDDELDSDAEDMEAFGKEFIENARKEGYKVQMDENFQITSVTKIKSPSANPYEDVEDED